MRLREQDSERDLLTAARMERMIEAPTAEEAAKVLTEIGYGVSKAQLTST